MDPESPKRSESLFRRASAKVASVSAKVAEVARASARASASALRGISKALNPIHKAKKILKYRFAYYNATRPDSTGDRDKIYKRALEILDGKWVKFMAWHPTMSGEDIPKYLADYAEKEAFREKSPWKSGGKKKGKSRKSSKSSKTRKNRKTRSRK